MAQIGDVAPHFSLPDLNGEFHSLRDFKNDNVVVYFYPKDNTPGCIIEAKEFSEALPSFKRLKTSIVGISGGNEASKRTFCEKNGLKLLLLSDSDFSTSKAYRAYGEKSFMGRKFKGIYRCTVVLDKDLKVVKRYDEVKARGHCEEVLDYLKSMRKGRAKD